MCVCVCVYTRNNYNYSNDTNNDTVQETLQTRKFQTTTIIIMGERKLARKSLGGIIQNRKNGSKKEGIV